MNIDNLNMDNGNLWSQLKEFTDNLNDYMNEYEQLTIMISRKLPEIERKIDENIDSATQLQNMINNSQSRSSDSGIAMELSQFNNQLNSVIETLIDSKNIDQVIFKDLRSTIDISNNSITKIKDIYNISENLKVFAINSIVYAQQAGIKGRGYQLISGQFIRLSEDLAKSTQNINSLGSRLNEEISDFLNKILEHDKFNHEHIELINRESEELIKNSNNSIKELINIMSTMVTHIKLVKDPTYKIMVILQKQDIIHQQMEHLHSVLIDMLQILKDNRGLKDVEGNRDVLTLLNFLLVTTEKQMNRINKDIINMINEMEVPIKEIFNALNRVKEDEKRLELTNSSDKSKTIISQLFQSPQNVINNIIDKLRISQEQKKSLIYVFKNIEEMMHTENKMAKNFIPLMEMIKNLLFLAQVEQARNQLDIVLNLDDKKSVFSNHVFYEMDDIITGINSAYEMVDQNLSNITVSFKNQEKNYKQIEVNLRNSGQFLQDTEVLFNKNFNSDLEITDRLFREVSEYKQLFDKMLILHREMNNKLGICSTLRTDVLQNLDRLGGAINLNDCSFRYTIIEEIINNLTVDEERTTIISEFPELNIEKSVGNTITLF
ncbi:MAG: methyl-accepting chemotaxis protein [Spirochaetales bacterium]|nr:methyl-accepting chemotaxis protein [Spirochaetales bacterium]